MDNIEALLISRAENELGIKLSSAQARQFQRYFELLVQWNEKMNLTAITDSREVVEKHFLDSLTLLKYGEIKENARIIDVGTGAGFPGIPLKIARPDIELTLLDSLNKRLTFLGAVCEDIKTDAKRIHRRAEEAGLDVTMREKYDLAVARAVAPLNILSEYCIPLVKMNGAFAAMKGPGARAELKAAENALRELGGGLPECKEFLLGEQERAIITVRKIKHTDKKYPRHGGTISKKPL